MFDKDFERIADAATMSKYCRCGDPEDAHAEGVFVERNAGDASKKACLTPFCRCGHFTPMTAWHPFGAQAPPRGDGNDEPEEAGP